jgi:hypothetical protein
MTAVDITTQTVLHPVSDLAKLDGNPLGLLPDR